MHQSLKLVHRRGSNQRSEGTADRMGQLLAILTCDEGIHFQSYNGLNCKEANNMIRNCAKEMSRWLTKIQDVPTAHRYLVKCSTSRIIREWQTKTPKRPRLTPVSMAVIKSTLDKRCQKGCAEKRTLVCCWW